jgi:hypothetical protein
MLDMRRPCSRSGVLFDPYVFFCISHDIALLTTEQEVASITDQRVELSLRCSDSEEGKWLEEDPGLPTLIRLAGNGNGR